MSLPHCPTQLLKEEAHRLWSYSDHCRTSCLRAAVRHVANSVCVKIAEFEKTSEDDLEVLHQMLDRRLRGELSHEERCLCDNGRALIMCVRRIRNQHVAQAEVNALCERCESLIMQQVQEDSSQSNKKQLIERDLSIMSYIVRRNICFGEHYHCDCCTAQQILCGMFLGALGPILETADARAAALHPAPVLFPVTRGNCPVIDHQDSRTGRQCRMVVVSLNYENYFPQLDLRHDDSCFRLLDRAIPDRGAFTSLSMLLREEGRFHGTFELLRRCGIFTDKMFLL